VQHDSKSPKPIERPETSSIREWVPFIGRMIVRSRLVRPVELRRVAAFLGLFLASVLLALLIHFGWIALPPLGDPLKAAAFGDAVMAPSPDTASTVDDAAGLLASGSAEPQAFGRAEPSVETLSVPDDDPTTVLPDSAAPTTVAAPPSPGPAPPTTATPPSVAVGATAPPTTDPPAPPLTDAPADGGAGVTPPTTAVPVDPPPISLDSCDGHGFVRNEDPATETDDLRELVLRAGDTLRWTWDGSFEDCIEEYVAEHADAEVALTRGLSLAVYGSPDAQFNPSSTEHLAASDHCAPEECDGNIGLVITIPDIPGVCYHQVDAVLGEPLETVGPYPGGDFYQLHQDVDRLVSARHGANGTYGSCEL
jgi:hypothetical protein